MFLAFHSCQIEAKNTKIQGILGHAFDLNLAFEMLMVNHSSLLQLKKFPVALPKWKFQSFLGNVQSRTRCKLSSMHEPHKLQAPEAVEPLLKRSVLTINASFRNSHKNSLIF